jgi:hypothetical protein
MVARDDAQARGTGVRLRRVPDELVPLAIQHGLARESADGWVSSPSQMARLRLIAAPAHARPAAPRVSTAPRFDAPPKRGRPEQPDSARQVRVREARDRYDRRARIAAQIAAQREQVGATRAALEALYDAQGRYIATLEHSRSSDAQVSQAHQEVLAAHDHLDRVQGRR